MSRSITEPVSEMASLRPTSMNEKLICCQAHPAQHLITPASEHN